MGNEKSKERPVLSEVSNYLLDLSKLVFGGIILVGIMDLEINTIAILIAGSIAASIFAAMGFIFLIIANGKNE